MKSLLRGWLWLALLAACSPLAFSQSVVSCSSDDMHLHTCNIGPNRGVRVVRQHSEAQCVQGQTYGVRGEQLWVDRGCRADFEVMSGRGGYGGYGGGYAGGGNVSVITCSSDDMRRHFCAISGNRARLVRQRSDAGCVEGQTWGVSGGQLWVDRGCRGDFEVRSSGGHGWGRDHDHDGDHDRDDHDWDRDHDRDRDHDQGYYGGGSNVRTVTCSSDDMHRHTCEVGPNGGIRMVRQRSGSPCQMNRTYGFSRDQIWVDRGCRADFEVVTRR